jgi:hypothetical protein
MKINLSLSEMAQFFMKMAEVPSILIGTRIQCAPCVHFMAACSFYLPYAWCAGQAVKQKKLKPGKTIPGCNTYFLCKYLKDTMVQAKTYLFCAIRPEVTYHKYTYATLGFAKNASVIKLAPKKAVTACSPAERKLMAELEEMKALVAELKGESIFVACVFNLQLRTSDRSAHLLTRFPACCGVHLRSVPQPAGMPKVIRQR